MIVQSEIILSDHCHNYRVQYDIILCTGLNDTVARLSLTGLVGTEFVSQYRL